MPTRRSFLASSGTAVAASFAVSQFTPRKVSAQSLGLNQNILNASYASHVTASADVYGETATGADWMNMSNAATAVYNNMIQTGFDANFKSAISNITISQINPSNLNQSQLLESIQVYQPSFQASDLGLLMSLVPTDQTSLSSALTSLQTNGLSSTVQSAASRFSRIAVLVNDAANSGAGGLTRINPFKGRLGTGQVIPASFNPAQKSAHLQHAVWQRIAQTLGSEGVGGYNCQTDGALALAAGTVFAVLGFMAGPAGALVYATEWGAIAVWGGSAAVAWGLGHAVFCGF